MSSEPIPKTDAEKLERALAFNADLKREVHFLRVDIERERAHAAVLRERAENAEAQRDEWKAITADIRRGVTLHQTAPQPPHGSTPDTKETT